MRAPNYQNKWASVTMMGPDTGQKKYNEKQKYCFKNYNIRAYKNN